MGLSNIIKKIADQPGSPISSVANVNQQSAIAPAPTPVQTQTPTPVQTQTPTPVQTQTPTPTAASLTPGYSALATPEKFLSALEQVGTGSQTDKARSLGDYIMNYARQTGEKLFPEGRLQEIKASAPSQKVYNIESTADMVRNLPGGLAKDIAAPALAGIMSLPYDAIQAYQRMKPESSIKGFYDAFMAENPLSSLVERFTGAAAPLAERISGTTPTTSISPYQEGSQSFGDQLIKEQSGIDVPYSPILRTSTSPQSIIYSGGEPKQEQFYTIGDKIYTAYGDRPGSRLLTNQMIQDMFGQGYTPSYEETVKAFESPDYTRGFEYRGYLPTFANGGIVSLL